MADPVSMKKLKRLAALAERLGKFNSPFKKLISHTFFLRRLSAVFFPIGEDVRIAKELSGKNLYRQLIERLILLLLFRKEPDSYYLLALFMPERYKYSGEYLDHRQQNYLNFLVNQKKTTILTEDKVLFDDLCARNNLASPRMLGVLDPHQKNGADLRNQLEETAENGGVFFKPRFGLKAQDTGRLKCMGKDKWTLKIGKDDTIYGTWKQLFEKLSSFDKPMVFQENLVNHPLLAEINSTALHTIRMCTFRSDGEIHILEAILRLGKKGSLTDNMSTGGIGVPILLEKQTLCAGGSIKIEDLPFSIKSLEPEDDNFEGLKVPFLDEAIALGKNVHECFPDIFSLGHDIAILPDGPVIIETNHIWGENQELFDHGLGANRFYIESILKTAEMRET